MEIKGSSLNTIQLTTFVGFSSHPADVSPQTTEQKHACNIHVPSFSRVNVFHKSKCGSDDGDGAGGVQVDAPSVSEQDEDHETRGVDEADEGEHGRPRQSDLDQVPRQRDQQQTCTTPGQQEYYIIYIYRNSLVPDLDISCRSLSNILDIYP